MATADGAELEADFVIAATGVLHHPFTPDIPGLDTFEGDVVHTARWDENIETSGRKIAVIGNGSTGVQIVSALQRDAAHISHFVRTPQWVIWAPMGCLSPGCWATILRRWPALHRRYYGVLLWGSRILTDIAVRPTWQRRMAQNYARLCLRLQIRDRELRDRLTPDYQPFCKRQVMSASYYRAIRADNAEVVTTEIEKITPRGIRTADGRETRGRPVDPRDRISDSQIHAADEVAGRDGLDIDDAWAKGPRAYRMTAIPGFPNFFTVLGPNSPTGSVSLQYSSELTARYITQWLQAIS